MFQGDFMTKLLYISSSKRFDYDVDAFLIGLEGFSVNMPIYFSLDEIKNIDTDKEIFVCINKNLHKSEIDALPDVLKKLDSFNIKGLFFYDVGVFNIAKRLGLKMDLVIAQEHANTNYQSINYWHDLGVNYNLLSTDISMNEINTIIDNTDSKLIMPVFGYQPMFVSKRHLVKNYLECFNLSDDSLVNYIEKEGKVYPIVDGDVTTVYTNACLNGLKEYFSLKGKIDYALINGFLISDDNALKIIDIFNSVNLDNLDEYNSDICNILDSNIDTFFLHKETIYKVK